MNKLALWLTVLLLVVFSLLSFLIPADPLLAIISAGVFVAAAFGVYRWGSAAFRVYFPSKKYEQPDSETSIGVLGLVLWLISEACKRVYAVTLISLGHPDWANDLYVSAFFNAMTLVGIILVVLATRIDGERPARLPNVLAGIISIFAVLLTYGLPIVIAKFVAISAMLAKIGIVVIH